ncbi:hypothetical protein N7495_008389 [Penicillium taxi]|uniref:uncharacterized protein n=1 Tax=Penicillium taxi TaxID=168475 RepID=UPI0025456A1C|nr:uncharacterized protein N7495_008389 [Penicillium taxi]KAJ5888348.1 hypothetical protein N7495_008389 [Penicillium taxi]
MALKQNTTSICTAAEAHIISYTFTIISPDFRSTAERAATMATHYLPETTFLIDGKVTQLSEPGPFQSLIKEALNSMDGCVIEVKGFRVTK